MIVCIMLIDAFLLWQPMNRNEEGCMSRTSGLAKTTP